MFNERLNFSPDRGITCVMQFNRNSHCLFYQHTSRAALPAPLLSPYPSYERRGLSVAVYIDGQEQTSSDIPERQGAKL